MESISGDVGIDVGKQTLEVHVPGLKPFSVPNTPEGVRRLAGRLPEGSTVNLESSGGYERLTAGSLRGRGFKVRVLNPYRVRQLARAVGPSAKTDRLDAKFLATSGKALPEPVHKTEPCVRLADHSRHVQRLKKQAAETRKRMGKPGLDPDVLASLERLAGFLDWEVLEAERAFAIKVKECSAHERFELARSVPSVGPVTARVVVSELPADLSGHSASTLASYAGLAPMDDQSGKRDAQRHVKAGNSHLKAALYMAALNAVSFQPWAKETYRRLRSKGRPHQAAIVAVMRRLLLRVVAVLKRGTPWQVVPPQRC